MKVLATARVGALVLTLLPLAACADDDKGPVVLPPAKSSTPASSAGSSPPGSEESSKPRKPRKPGEFDEATKRSAEEFVREWWLALNDTLQGGSPEQLRRFYAPACRRCAEKYATAKEFHAKGWAASERPYDLIDFRYEYTEGSVTVLRAVVRPNPTALMDAEGNSVRTVTGGPPIDLVTHLAQRGDSWRIQYELSQGPRKK